MADPGRVGRSSSTLPPTQTRSAAKAKAFDAFHAGPRSKRVALFEGAGLPQLRSISWRP